MEKKNGRGSAINKRQKELLVERVQEHPKLLTGKFDNGFTHKMARELWTKIGSELNEIPNGANKEWEQWRKTWQDLKKNAKSKSARITNYMRGTGGGEQPEEVLNEIEENIINTMCPTLVNGHTEVEESFVEIVVNSEEDKENNASFTEREHTYATSDACGSNSETPQPKRRLNKTKRLQTSLNISYNLQKLSEQKNNSDREYHSAKIAVMEREQVARREYENQKLCILRNSQNTLCEILNELKTLASINMK